MKSKSETIILVDMDDVMIDLVTHWVKTMWKEGYKIFVCTNTHWKNVKFKIKHVLLKYFDFIPWRNVIITSYKQMLKADYLIDDAVHNLRGGEYKKLLFNKPHNAKFNAAGTDIVRVDNWKEIYNYISLSCV